MVLLVSLMPFIQWLFFALLFVFGVHTLILGYHWFNYGTKRAAALWALCTYLAGGAIFFAIMWLAFLAMT